MNFNNTLKLAMILIFTVVSSEIYAQKIGRTMIDENGKIIVETIIDGRPPKVLPEPSKNLPKEEIKGVVFWLDSIPSYDWCFGCSATAIAMQAGYFDNTGFPDIYTGPANGGVQPMTNAVWNAQATHTGSQGECPVSATAQNVDGRDKKGHVDDYWVDYFSTGDPYFGSWTEHLPVEAGYNICTADYMGTNQYNNYGNVDGSTSFFNYPDGSPLYNYSACEPTQKDGCRGARQFYEACGVTVIDNFNQYIYGYQGNTLGYTFAQYKAEIDSGNPVAIHVAGHTMLGYGYDNTDEQHPIVYLRNTWTQDRTVGGEQMEWGGIYSDMLHYAVTVIHLEPQVLAIPENVTTSVAGTTLTISWDSIPGASSYNLYSYDDPYGTGTFLANTTNTTYDVQVTPTKMFYYVVSSDSK